MKRKRDKEEGRLESKTGRHNMQKERWRQLEAEKEVDICGMRASAEKE